MFAGYVIRPSLNCVSYAFSAVVLRSSPHVRNYVATRNSDTDHPEFKRIVVLRKTINEKKSQIHVVRSCMICVCNTFLWINACISLVQRKYEVTFITFFRKKKIIARNMRELWKV